MNQRTWRSHLLVALGLVALLPACGDDREPGGTKTDPPGASEPGAQAGGELEVTGVEYKFKGLSGAVAAGTKLTFTNGGKEAHELVLMRVKDGETRSLAELLKLPEKEVGKVTEFQGVAVADPGKKGKVVEGKLALAKPGRYAALCFIPVGTKELPKGPPQEGDKPGRSAPRGQGHGRGVHGRVAPRAGPVL